MSGEQIEEALQNEEPPSMQNIGVSKNMSQQGDDSNFSVHMELMGLNRSVQRFTAVQNIAKSSHFNHSIGQVRNQQQLYGAVNNKNFSHIQANLSSEFTQQQLKNNSDERLSKQSGLGNESKYNYYGRSKYRFEEYQEAINPPKAQVSQRPFTAHNQHRGEQTQSKLYDTLSEHPIESQNADIDSMALMDMHQEKFHQPAENYFILFDDPKKSTEPFQYKNFKTQEKRVKQNSKNKNTSQVNLGKRIFQPERDIGALSKPNWILQRKVDRLEKQLKQMKKKEENRKRMQNFSHQTYGSKKDHKVKLNGQVQRMLNTLWP